MASILESLEDLASPAVVSALSGQTGESESAVSTGMRAAIPAIAGVMAHRSDDQGFMQTMAGLATRTADLTSPAPGDVLSSSAVSNASGMGRGALSEMFGGNVSDLAGNISRYAGIRSSSAMSLLSFGAPLVLGYFGRLMRSRNLTADGLADLLRANRPQLASALPSGFEMPASIRPEPAAERSVEMSQSWGWSAPLLGLLALLGIGGLIWWGGGKRSDETRVAVAEPQVKAVGTTGTMPTPGPLSRMLPGNVIVLIPRSGSAEDRLSAYLASTRAGQTTIGFDRIAFDSGSGVLKSESNAQIDTIATILRAYPRSEVTIAGYTDSVGNESANAALSGARAKAVAERLTTDGVPADRVHAAGHGSETPVGDNATEAGRAQNRRVELQVSVR